MVKLLIGPQGETEAEFRHGIRHLPAAHQRDLIKDWRKLARPAAVDEPEAPSREEEPETETEAEAGTPQEAPPAPGVVAPEARQNGAGSRQGQQHYTPLGTLTPQACALPGLEHVIAHFDLEQLFDTVDLSTNMAYYRIQNLLQKQARDDDGKGNLRRLMLLCPRIDWNEIDILTGEPVPPALAPDLESYVYMLRFPELGVWLLTEGWKQAVENRSSFLSGSETPSRK